MKMLRRDSVSIDVDRINMAGMTALHQVKKHAESALPMFYKHGRYYGITPSKEACRCSIIMAGMTALHQNLNSVCAGKVLKFFNI